MSDSEYFSETSDEEMSLHDSEKELEYDSDYSDKSDGSEDICTSKRKRDNDGEERPENDLNNKPKRMRKYKDFTDTEYDELLKLNEVIISKTVDERDIINANVPFEDKVWGMEQLVVLSGLDKRSEEYFIIRNRLYRRIHDNNSVMRSNIVSLKDKILNSQHSDEIKSYLYTKYKLLDELSDDEKYKITEQIENVLKLPTEYKPVFQHDPNSLDVGTKLCQIKRCLDNHIYGQEMVKHKLLQMTATMFNGSSKGNIMGMEGPPGIGKTAIARAYAESLGLPFYQISMGGKTNPEYFAGHGVTYVGAQPGIFVKMLQSMEFTNGVLLLDEFDKEMSKEVRSIMFHVLDYTQNNCFRDAYIPEIPIDLSKLIVLLSVNDLDRDDNGFIVGNNHIRALYDRIPFMIMDGYSKEEKVTIGLKYFIPKIARDIGLDTNRFEIKKEVVEKMIDIVDKKERSGVRNMERMLRLVLEKINILILTNGGNGLNLSYGVKNMRIPFVVDDKTLKRMIVT